MIGWIDGRSGASGDMLLGALIDAGVPIEVIRDALDPLDLGVVLRVEQVNRAGLAATRVHVDVPESTTHRHLADVVGLLERVTEPTRSRAVAVFERLAGAEAMVHGISIAEVHFHEVGALDSIADVVGVCAGFVELGLAELHCSTLSLGSGQVNGAHGPIPVPAPAVLAVLEGLAPVTSGPAPFEATTPTGAALLAEWVSNWGPMPPMIVAASGVGAGARDSEIVANVVRFVVGSGGADRDAAIPNDVAIQIDANVDDLDPRLWPSVIMAAMDAGAFDAWVTPIVMKKGRPAHTLSVLCSPQNVEALRRLVFAQTSTIGVREREVVRHMLERCEGVVDVDGQTIRVKIASLEGEVVNRSVEWVDVAAAATALGRPANDVLAAANAAAREL